MREIKTSNPHIKLECDDSNIVFDGGYAVVHGIARKVYLPNSKTEEVVGVIDENFKEADFKYLNFDDELIECDELKFRKDNIEIFNYDGNDFIVICVLRDENEYDTGILALKHIRVIDNDKVIIITENIANNLTNVRKYKNFLLADNFIYNVKRAKIELDNRTSGKRKVAKI